MLSTDIREAQWIQSAIGYNRDTTAFNYTQNATSIPSMQLDYSRFMDSVMTATQPTQKYPAYAASNPSSVQPTSQGVGVRKASGSVLSSWLKSHTGDPIQLATDAVNYYVDHQQQIDATLERFTDPVLKPVERLLAPVLQAGAEGLDWFNDTMVNPMMPALTSEGLGSLPDAIEYLTVALSKAATSLRELSAIESELAGGVSSTADASASKVSVSKFSFMRNAGQTSETLASASDPAVFVSKEYTEAALEQVSPVETENVPRQGSVGSMRAWTEKARIKAAQLPNEGKVRFVPRDDYHPSMPLPKGERQGYIDKFDNEWTKGPSRTPGESFEWDVQLSDLGKKQLGWASRDGKHVNVSLMGKITHR